ncbi:MAG TPA: DUF2318 domain-containing protein [Anaerolineae bacterium]|nr:DUF2318 domain-containing protein [Anaerolineae bacterium]
MTQTGSRDAKRARFGLEKKTPKPKGASPLVLVAGLAVVLAVLGGTLYALSRPAGRAAAAPLAGDAGKEQPVQAATQGHDPYPLLSAEEGVVRLPAAALADGVARFCTVMVNGRAVELFVVRDGSGAIRAALNACEVCFPGKLGYHQEGEEMVCSNCGRRIPVSQVGAVHGGCNPAPLSPAVEGDSIVIQASELVDGLRLF